MASHLAGETRGVLRNFFGYRYFMCDNPMYPDPFTRLPAFTSVSLYIFPHFRIRARTVHVAVGRGISASGSRRYYVLR